MQLKSKYIDIVNNIPVDQEAKATPLIKKFLLGKVQEIIGRKQTIENAAKQKRKDEVLDAYKKSVGYDIKAKRLKKLEDEMKELEEQITDLGLAKDGGLIQFQEYKRTSQLTEWGFYDTKGHWVVWSADKMKKILEVQELLKAVEGEVDAFSIYDQLESRMILASTVGEAMAIVNALLGEDVFKIDPGVLQLENKK